MMRHLSDTAEDNSTGNNPPIDRLGARGFNNRPDADEYREMIARLRADSRRPPVKRSGS